MPSLLILGGTQEAAELARHLTQETDWRIITSLAGRTRNPASLPGEVRIGGFGGSSGLVRYLQGEQVNLLVDATHPFALRMPVHAERAAGLAGVPRIKLLRPAWQAEKEDRWISVPSLQQAAQVLPRDCKAFLATGRQELEPFTQRRDVEYLIRLVDSPEDPLPLARYSVIAQRGPFRFEEEQALLREHAIDCLVSKNSGGSASYAKIQAARALALPIIMVERPPVPPGALARSVTEALDWIGEIIR
ncbi:cobalt-precorrin-6A reductase [Fodinicurvata sediminis]|uniref:cobalt-precorrin-6A reductase n=1 Tax=Fodinicurvata sediminis TaxID=1121832 RepID=UPI0003B72EA0|nr:cobalt-precorrin-6A reductase [Fodinicurvata sediminis]